MITELTARVEPASVLEVAEGRLRLKIDEEVSWAVPALGYPYRPAVGDTVLALGQESRWYVIGVIHGRGLTSFTAPADLELRAPNGSIGLVASGGVRIEAPEVALRADRLELTARSVFERFVRAYRRVAEAFHLKAGRVRTVVDGAWDVRAGRIAERADGDVRIDGNQIHLG